MIECIWYSGSSVTTNDYYGPWNFHPGGVVTVSTPNGQVVTGQWNIVLTDAGIFLILEMPEPYSDLSGEWELYECEENWIKFIMGDHYIVFEADCSNEYDCPDQQANVGDECETANGQVGVLNEECECVTDNTFDCPDYQSNVGDPCENPNGATGYLNEDCNCVTDDPYDCPDLQSNFGDLCETPNGQPGFINENCECEVETPNPFECFEEIEFVICDDEAVYDGFAAFDLNYAYPNCPTDEVEVTFHVSLADAETGMEPLASPYTNTSNPQTIYARVTLSGTVQYEVFPVHLYVENCNPNACTIGAIEDYLLTCEWIPVSVAGSDDFSTVYLQFLEDGTLNAEGLGQFAQGNWILTGDASNGVYLLISGFNNVFQVFIGEWLVAQCSPNDMVLINNANTGQILLQQECN